MKELKELKILTEKKKVFLANSACI